MSAPSPTRPGVVYGNDALCGWCFAIGPDVLEAHRRTAGRFEWRVECGGLVVGDRVRPIAEDRHYLRAGLAQVEAVSGRTAGAAYFDQVLEPGTWVSDSEPSCRAVLIAQELDAGRVFEFTHALTDALYVEGREPDRPDTLHDVAARCGIDADELLRRWTAPSAAAVTEAAFARARRLGITTYPSLFLDRRDGSELTPVLAGWADADTIVAGLRSAR